MAPQFGIREKGGANYLAPPTLTQEQQKATDFAGIYPFIAEKFEALKQELKIGDDLLVQAKALALSPMPLARSPRPIYFGPHDRAGNGGPGRATGRGNPPSSCPKPESYRGHAMPANNLNRTVNSALSGSVSRLASQMRRLSKSEGKRRDEQDKDHPDKGPTMGRCVFWMYTKNLLTRKKGNRSPPRDSQA